MSTPWSPQQPRRIPVVRPAPIIRKPVKPRPRPVQRSVPKPPGPRTGTRHKEYREDILSAGRVRKYLGAKKHHVVKGSGRASPTGTFKYEAGILGVEKTKKHFEDIGYIVTVKTSKKKNTVNTPTAPRLSVDELTRLATLHNIPGAPSVPKSTTTNIYAPKRFTETVDEVVLTPIQWSEEHIAKPLQTTMAREKKNPATLFVSALGLSTLRFGQGVYEGVTSLVRPWSIAEGVASIVSPKGRAEIVEAIARDPTQISRIAGALVGGHVAGKIVGKTIGYIKTRAQPSIEEFELQPTKWSPRKVVATTRHGYMIRFGYYVEEGTAKPVMSLGRNPNLIGEYSVEMMRSGDWVYTRAYGYKLPGKEMLRIPVKPETGAATPYRPELVIGKTYRIYGLPGKGKVIEFAMEKIFYRGKPVWESKTLVTDIKVKRIIGLRTKTVYTAKRLTLSTSYVIDTRAGSIAPQTILQPKPLAPRAIVPVTYEYSIPLEPLTPLALRISTSKNTEPLTHAPPPVLVKPRIINSAELVIGLKQLTRPASLMLPRQSVKPSSKLFTEPMVFAETLAGQKTWMETRLAPATVHETIVVPRPRHPSFPRLVVLPFSDGKKPVRKRHGHRRRKKRSMYVEMVFPEVSAPL